MPVLSELFSAYVVEVGEIDWRMDAKKAENLKTFQNKKGNKDKNQLLSCQKRPMR